MRREKTTDRQETERNKRQKQGLGHVDSSRPPGDLQETRGNRSPRGEGGRWDKLGIRRTAKKKVKVKNTSGRYESKNRDKKTRQETQAHGIDCRKDRRLETPSRTSLIPSPVHFLFLHSLSSEFTGQRAAAADVTVAATTRATGSWHRRRRTGRADPYPGRRDGEEDGQRWRMKACASAG